MSIESRYNFFDAGRVGDKTIRTTEVSVGALRGQLHVFEKDAPTVSVPKIETPKPLSAEQVEAKNILDRARQPLSENEVLAFYSGEAATRVMIGKETFVVPFTNDVRDQYFENETRLATADYRVGKEYTSDGELRSFQDRLVQLEIAGGRRLTNGSITTVGAYNPASNTLDVRRAGYFDIAATNNIGLDMKFEPLLNKKMVRDGHAYETLRQLESPNGKLRPLGDSLLANVLGIGGILLTKDGQLVIPQRRVGGGVASLDGTYGLSASGNVEWDERKLDRLGLHSYLGDKMKQEMHEEVGLDTKARSLNIGKYIQSTMAEYLHSEIGIDADRGEALITPLAFTRDMVRGGLPQMFYLFNTKLSAAEIPERMAGAPDAKKEYNQVLILPFTAELVATVLRNKIPNMNFNQEIRAAIAYAYSALQIDQK